MTEVDPALEEVLVSQETNTSAELQAPDGLLHPRKYAKRAGAEAARFRSPHGYYIPSTSFEQALRSPSGSYASHWKHSMYQKPGERAEKVQIDYCTTKESMERVAKQFLNDDVIGFDMEWVPYTKSTDEIKKNLSLIQIANEKRIALFHLARFPGAEKAEDFVSPALRTLMESSAVTKTGVMINGDSTRLRKYLGLQCRGLMELSRLHKLVAYCSGEIEKVDGRWVKLSELVQTHLGLPLFKGQVRFSDWSQDLRSDQIECKSTSVILPCESHCLQNSDAASDAYAGLHLFYELEHKRKSFDPTPERPANAELKTPCKRRKKRSEDSQALSSASSLASLAITSPESDKKPAEPCPPQPYANELEQANKLIDSYKAESGRPHIPPQNLRAYSLWHQQGLDIPTVAGILRAPPLLERTVMGYICNTILASPAQFHCPAENIKSFQTIHGYHGYTKPQKDLIAKAVRDCEGTG